MDSTSQDPNEPTQLPNNSAAPSENQAMKRVLHREMWGAYRRREKSNDLVREINKKVDEINLIDKMKRDEEDYYTGLKREKAEETTKTKKPETENSNEGD